MHAIVTCVKVKGQHVKVDRGPGVFESESHHLPIGNVSSKEVQVALKTYSEWGCGDD